MLTSAPGSLSRAYGGAHIPATSQLWGQATPGPQIAVYSHTQLLRNTWARYPKQQSPQSPPCSWLLAHMSSPSWPDLGAPAPLGVGCYSQGLDQQHLHHLRTWRNFLRSYAASRVRVLGVGPDILTLASSPAGAETHRAIPSGPVSDKKGPQSELRMGD